MASDQQTAPATPPQGGAAAPPTQPAAGYFSSWPWRVEPGAVERVRAAEAAGATVELQATPVPGGGVHVAPKGAGPAMPAPDSAPPAAPAPATPRARWYARLGRWTLRFLTQVLFVAALAAAVAGGTAAWYMHGELRDARADRSAASARAHRVQSAVAGLRDDLASARSDRDDLKRQLADAKTDLDGRDQEIAALRTALVRMSGSAADTAAADTAPAAGDSATGTR